MAYNPGIVDRSGEILAQSRLAGGMALLGGVSQGIDAFLKKKEEKKNEQEAIAFVKTQFPGIDDAAAKAGIKATGGVAAFIKQQQDAVQNDMNQKVQNLQLADLQRTAAERARLDSENKRLREALKGLSPVESAIAGGAAFKQLPDGADAFTRIPPKNVSEFIDVARNAGIDPSVWLPVATQMGNLDMTNAQANALARQGQSVEERRFQQQQMDKARDDDILNRARQIAFGQEGESLPNRNDELAAKAEAAKISEAGRTKTSESRIDPETGEPIIEQVERDITGNVIGREPIYRPDRTADEDRKSTILTKQAELDVDWVDRFRNASSDATVRIAQNTRAIDLLSRGDVKTGPGTPILQAMNRVFVSFGGSPDDIKKVADYGLAVNLLSNQLLDYFSKTKGAISDYETKRFSDFAANERKTPAENLAILRMMVEIDTRNQRALSDMNQQKITDPRDQRRFLEQYAEENPLNFSQLESVSTPKPSQAIFDQADAIVNASAKLPKP